MTNTEINRKIVQDGLNRRSEQRKEAQDDARHDAYEKALRAKIHSNCTIRKLEVIATEDAKRRNAERMASEEAQRVADARRKKRDNCHEAAECSSWYRLLVSVFAPLMIAAVILSFTTNPLGTFAPASIYMTAPWAIAACTVSVYNLIAHYRRRKEN